MSEAILFEIMFKQLFCRFCMFSLKLRKNLIYENFICLYVRNFQKDFETKIIAEHIMNLYWKSRISKTQLNVQGAPWNGHDSQKSQYKFIKNKRQDDLDRSANQLPLTISRE